jgi:SAM-dependent methyltransferase
MLTAIKRYYLQQQIGPGLGGLLLNPFYFARRGLHLQMQMLGGRVQGRVLDVGCGSKPYESLFRASEYVGLEIDSPANRTHKRADVYYDGISFPFDASTYDCVVCNQVLEHVFNPEHFLNEVGRILRPGGLLLLSVPFAWDEHEQPWDYARYSSFGLSYLLDRKAFEITYHAKTNPDFRAVIQLLNAYLYKATVTRSAYLNLLSTVVLMAPFNLLGSLLYRVLPSNPDLFLDNVVLARKRPQGASA